MKILIVDDSLTMRRILNKMLKDAGYDSVIEAGNGLEALASLPGVDLVLTDRHMPMMDGIAFLNEMRSKPEYKLIPVIMITAVGGEADVLAALKSGADDFVVKPFNTTVVLKKIATLLERHSSSV